jgi:hypothetical protein
MKASLIVSRRVITSPGSVVVFGGNHVAQVSTGSAGRRFQRQRAPARGPQRVHAHVCRDREAQLRTPPRQVDTLAASYTVGKTRSGKRRVSHLDDVVFGMDTRDRGDTFDGVKIGRPATGALIDAGYLRLTDLPEDLNQLNELHGVGPSAIKKLKAARPS